MRRFMLVRLLLGVILINIVLTTLFVLTVAGDFPLLASLVPGEVGFHAGAWGNYVFLALAVMINAIFILSSGFLVLLPTIGDPDQARVVEDIGVARWIFRIGALLFILAFPVVCFTVAHAEPQAAMFVDSNGPVSNVGVGFDDVLRFSADQTISAITFNAPEIFHRQLAALSLNSGEPWMPTVILVFRIVVTLTFLTALVAAGRQSALAEPEETEAGVKPKEKAE
jgi:hypothetical protein